MILEDALIAGEHGVRLQGKFYRRKKSKQGSPRAEEINKESSLFRVRVILGLFLFPC